MRYCGREFSNEEIQWYKRIISDNPGIHRKELSIRFCETFDWRKPDGGLKDMSCRVAQIQMDRDGIITLPKPQNKNNRARKRVNRTLLAEPRPKVSKSAGAFKLELEIAGKSWSSLWNEYIDRYHYLRYTPLPGAQLRYFVKSEGEILALLGFGAAAWKTAPRDRYIGWTAQARKKNLHLVVNNARFLILPWVCSKNLGSRILSLVSKRIADDWYRRYNYRPVLLETFVEKTRFRGTCYKASNWTCLGDTQGRGKLDVKHENKQPVKSVWVYPLIKSFRRYLCREEPWS